MPPKKKKDAVTKKADELVDKLSQQAQKQVSQEVKPAAPSKPAQTSKPAQIKPAEKKPAEKKVQEKKPEQKSQGAKPSMDTKSKNVEQIAPKAENTNTANMSEEEKIARRKQKFLNQESQDTLKARMDKFGAKDKKEQEEKLKERRLKFSNNPALISQDPEVLKKRREKFQVESKKEDDPSIIEQRKAKFGANDIALDDIPLDNRPKHNKKFNRFDRSRPKDHSGRKFDNIQKRHNRG